MSFVNRLKAKMAEIQKKKEEGKLDENEEGDRKRKRRRG